MFRRLLFHIAAKKKERYWKTRYKGGNQDIFFLYYKRGK